jgi:hypothetical protein
MTVEQLLRAIEKLKARGLHDHHLVTLQIFQEKPSAVAEATLDSVALVFEENWRSTHGDADADHLPYLMLVAREAE